ncbi:MAG: hypothetical protein ISR75_00800 [Phycisphaerales bacterium]|nr:hypothetical protein [Planctomycetota bacterium]MBL6996961.1 hypothetical protein [Phycisphaerales bacterium]
MRTIPIVICFVSLTIALGLRAQSEEHVNAKVLGQLVYSDITVKLDEVSSKKALDDFEKQLGIMLWVQWKDDESVGLDSSETITLELKEQPALVVLERIVEQLDHEGNAAWQLRHGALEVGLKSQLASPGRHRLETYYIRDLLFTIRNFDAPELGTFGGSGRDGDGSGTTPPTQQEEIDRIIELIIKFIEPDLWEQNGGPCSITNYKKTLLIRAPDFVHRQINGYGFLARQPAQVRQRRVIYSKDKTRIVVDRLPIR